MQYVTTIANYDIESDSVNIIVDENMSINIAGNDRLRMSKVVKKTRKKAKKNVETKTLTQTITKVKFKKIKSGKSYRITETNGTIYETVADHDAEDNGGGTYFVTGNENYFSFFSQDVESVYLIETSEIS